MGMHIGVVVLFSDRQSLVVARRWIVPVWLVMM